MIIVLGPTATGKTAFAAQLASKINGEIISADSRQVYRGLDLGTGKDFEDYTVDGIKIPYHLVDIVDPGYEYNVYEFQQDFLKVYKDIKNRKKTPVLCGGTGMYLESVLKGYQLIKVPDNLVLRKELENKSMEDLRIQLASFKSPHNITDTNDRKRLVRAIEIQQFYTVHPELIKDFPKIDHIIFGIYFERDIIRKRITERLENRLESGMTNEIKELLNQGLTPDQLKFYGLEYKYLTQYEMGEISKDEMFNLLNTAIHQFAKRQMTWFRKMERQGHRIHWIDGQADMESKIDFALNIIKTY
jgi:tRNA dimethylallyltransferase